MTSHRYSVIITSRTDPDYSRVVGVGLTLQAAARRVAAVEVNLNHGYEVDMKEEQLA